MPTEYTRAELLLLPKKQIIRLCGYDNMKALCKANPSMSRSLKKGPSRKTLIKLLT